MLVVSRLIMGVMTHEQSDMTTDSVDTTIAGDGKGLPDCEYTWHTQHCVRWNVMGNDMIDEQVGAHCEYQRDTG